MVLIWEEKHFHSLFVLMWSWRSYRTHNKYGQNLVREKNQGIYMSNYALLFFIFWRFIIFKYLEVSLSPCYMWVMEPLFPLKKTTYKRKKLPGTLHRPWWIQGISSDLFASHMIACSFIKTYNKYKYYNITVYSWANEQYSLPCL